MEKASTSLVERQNRTMRMHMRRMMRLCDVFSKKRENHDAATALHFAYYNIVRLHETLGTTPAVALRVTDKPWTLAELVDVALAEEESAPPVARPLAPRPGAGPARALPGGRGFLRLVGRADPPTPVPSAPDTQLVAVAPPVQGDLFEWAVRPPKPLPPVGTQLTLFGDEDEWGGA
jgi:hypothetical protein